MPVKEIKVDAKRANYVSLDYDGIRLVYPNTTFGPGFGHRLEPKSNAENPFVGIESQPYSLFQDLTTEERQGLLQMTGLDTIQDSEPSPSVYLDPDINTKSNRLLDHYVKSYRYVHKQLFADNDEARARLDKKVSELKKNNHVETVAEVVLLQAIWMIKDTRKHFGNLMQINNFIVNSFLNIFGVYLADLRDHELLYYFDQVIRPFTADMSSNLATRLDIYKNVCIMMHCINIVKVILDKLSIKYASNVVLVDSQISAIVTFLKHIYTINLNDEQYDTEETMKAFYQIIMNMQMMFYYIKYRNKDENNITMYNYQDEINKLEVQINLFEDLMRHVDEKAKEVLQNKIEALDRRINDIEKSMQEFRVDNHTDRSKLYFWPQDRFSAKLAEIYLYATTDLHKNKILGSQLVDNTSHHLRFDEDCKVVNDIEAAYDRLLDIYLSTLYKNFDLFFSMVKGIFDLEPEARDKIIEKYKIFTYPEESRNKFPLLPIYDKKKDGMIRTFKRHPQEYVNYINRIHDDDFLLVSTNELEPTKWSEFIKDVEMLFSEENVTLIKSTYTKRFNIANMLINCLRPFQNIYYYDEETKKKLADRQKTKMYLIKISNVRDGISINDFMDDLFHYMRFVADNIKRESSNVHKDPNFDLTDRDLTSVANVDIDDLINSIHLIDHYTTYSYYWRGRKETRIILGINNRYALFQFMYIMFKHDFNAYALSRPRNPLRTTTYLLHKTKPLPRNSTNTNTNTDPNVFFLWSEVPNPDSVQFDLYTKVWKKQGRIARLVARTYETNKLSYHIYKTLDSILKSCAIYSTSYYLVPKVDKKSKKLVYIKKYEQKYMRKTENMVHFYSNVIKSLMWYISSNSASEEPTKTFREELNRVIGLVDHTRYDILDLITFAKTPEHVYDAVADECYLAMCYNYDRSFTNYRVDFRDIDRSRVSESMKTIFRAFVDREVTIKKIMKKYKKPYKVFKMLGPIAAKGLPRNIITKGTNEIYYYHCVKSFMLDKEEDNDEIDFDDFDEDRAAEIFMWAEPKHKHSKNNDSDDDDALYA